MKLSNFRNRKVLPSGAVTAEVDVQYKKFFFFPVSKTEVVYRRWHRWCWLKTGEQFDSKSQYEIECLESAYQVLAEIHMKG